ncbi:Uncharacterised protein [Mycobacteroides abscessus subsp. abscessus]|nr:Uncharacterised protein [Mycobacteroides abscessus subsp. abscessus]
MASALRPRRAASCAISSGRLAPSRKLNAECACNSAYGTTDRPRSRGGGS